MRISQQGVFGCVRLYNAHHVLPNILGFQQVFQLTPVSPCLIGVLLCVLAVPPPDGSPHALFCVSSCSKSCFFLCLVVLQIVLFSVFGRAPNRALFCVWPCTKLCSFLRFVVHQIVFFSAFRRARNRALFCVSSCAKLCPKVSFIFLPKRLIKEIFVALCG